jgi:SAM-dependent methyltransferase
MQREQRPSACSDVGSVYTVGDPQGLAFDSTVHDYERGRTGWPSAVVDGVAADHVLDLAAGTGKLTRVLVQRFPQVTAVEPLPAMRSLGADLVPEAMWLDGAAEQVPLADGAVGAAFVAEAYHWFDSHQATSELARVLRPDSPLIILFTEWDGSFEPGLPAEAMQAVSEVSERTGTAGGPKWMSGAWQSGFDDAPFTALDEHRIPFSHVTDREGLISYYLSVSTIAARPVEEREALRAELRRLAPEGEHRLSVFARLYRTNRL